MTNIPFSTIVHNVETGALYHRRRQVFYQWLFTWHCVVVIVFTGIGLHELATGNRLPFGLAVALMTIPFIMDASRKGKQHEWLRNRYIHLEQHLFKKEDFVADDLACVVRELKNIEWDAPPVLPTLVALCQDQVARRAGYSAADYPPTHVPWYRRWLVHFF